MYREYDEGLLCDKKQDFDRAVIWLSKDRWLSKSVPRLRAEVTGVMVVSESTTNTGLLSLGNCCGVQMTKNSVLLGLSESKLDDARAMTD